MRTVKHVGKDHLQKRSMHLFGRKLPKKSDEPANQTSTGVRMLKEVWDIKTAKKEESLPKDISSDIYSIKPKSSGIPPRYRGRRRLE